MSVSIDGFPDRSGNIVAEWAPILLAPNPDTPECFVIGVIACAENGFHIEAADAGKRLSCIYGASSATALLVQQASLAALEEQIVRRGREALSDFEAPFSGVSLGQVRVGEAPSLEELASVWLKQISSLHQPRRQPAPDMDDPVENAIEAIDAMAANDRLPVLVYRAVEETAPDLGNYFSAEIRSRAKQTPKPPPQKVFIGFAGARVVANFASLKQTARPRPAIDHIKRLMWDLARHRDNERGPLYTRRAHEMIVFRRDDRDPELTEQAAKDLREMVEDLADQGAKDEIDVQSRTSVPSIADHIRSAEAVTFA